MKHVIIFVGGDNVNAIDKMYIKEKRKGLKYCDTLRLTFLFYLEYLYSLDYVSNKSLDDLIKEMNIKDCYDEKEISNIKENASCLLKIKYGISILNFFPLTYHKN